MRQEGNTWPSIDDDGSTIQWGVGWFCTNNDRVGETGRRSIKHMRTKWTQSCRLQQRQQQLKQTTTMVTRSNKRCYFHYNVASKTRVDKAGEQMAGGRQGRYDRNPPAKTDERRNHRPTLFSWSIKRQTTQPTEEEDEDEEEATVTPKQQTKQQQYRENGGEHNHTNRIQMSPHDYKDL